MFYAFRQCFRLLVEIGLKDGKYVEELSQSFPYQLKGGFTQIWGVATRF